MEGADLPPNFDSSKSTVYMANLPYHLKPDDIEAEFERFGRIIKVTLLRVKETRKSKGVAFVLFENANDARTCVEHSNNTLLNGQLLRVSMAKDNGKRLQVFQKPLRTANEYQKHRSYTPY